MEEDQVEIDATLPGKKRQLEQGVGTSVGGGQGAAWEASARGSLSATVGEGEYAQPLMMGMVQAMLETARDVADLLQAVVRSYEGPVQWKYAVQAKKQLQTYAEQARAVRGQGVSLGPPRNYAAIGLMHAFLTDTARTRVQKEELREILRPRVLESVQETAEEPRSERVVLRKAQKMGDLVTYCQVVTGPKKSYVNVQFTDTAEGCKLKSMMDEALLQEGERQWDTAPLKPVHRDLRTAMMQAKGWGKGK